MAAAWRLSLGIACAMALALAGLSCAPNARISSPATDAPSALVGKRYRVRWGALDMPGIDDSVDARTGIYGFPAEGPFEQELEIRVDEIASTPTADDASSPSPRRGLQCIDVRPSTSRLTGGATKNTVVVLDVQPLGDAPAVPFAVDARTGERVATDATKLMDEDNMPCDRRMHRRAAWDDNLLRLHQRGRPRP